MKSSPPAWPMALSIMAAHPAFRYVYTHFALESWQQMPPLSWLNSKSRLSAMGLDFVDQSLVPAQGHYYEQIIMQQKHIPVRLYHYHDFFNALVWRQFPLSKYRLSELHNADIERVGTRLRTPRRHQITHWDECGLLLVTEQRNVTEVLQLWQALSTHQWHLALWDMQHCWNSLIHPVVFGHATLEALLVPFDELTVKWLPLIVPNGFVHLSTEAQLCCIDEMLEQQIAHMDDFAMPDVLRPLPLCGIPGWWQDQDKAFYDNARVFRPARRHYASVQSMISTMLL